MAALEAAVSLADSLHGEVELVLLHVWSAEEKLLVPTSVRTDPEERTVARMLAEARSHDLHLEHALTFLERIEARGLAIEAKMEGGPIAETIVRHAKENGYDLIVMGTHGRGGLGAAVLGSVAERVVRSSEVPVMTARMPATPARMRRAVSNGS